MVNVNAYHKDSFYFIVYGTIRERPSCASNKWWICLHWIKGTCNNSVENALKSLKFPHAIQDRMLWNVYFGFNFIRMLYIIKLILTMGAAIVALFTKNSRRVTRENAWVWRRLSTTLRGHTKRRATIGRPRGNGIPHSQICHRSVRSMFTSFVVVCASDRKYWILLLLCCTNNSKCNTEWYHLYL